MSYIMTEDHNIYWCNECHTHCNLTEPKDPEPYYELVHSCHCNEDRL